MAFEAQSIDRQVLKNNVVALTSPPNIDRVARLGGGIAIQHRTKFKGKAFVARSGRYAAEAAPTPI